MRVHSSFSDLKDGQWKMEHLSIDILLYQAIFQWFCGQLVDNESASLRRLALPHQDFAEFFPHWNMEVQHAEKLRSVPNALSAMLMR